MAHNGAMYLGWTPAAAYSEKIATVNTARRTAVNKVVFFITFALTIGVLAGSLSILPSSTSTTLTSNPINTFNLGYDPNRSNYILGIADDKEEEFQERVDDVKGEVPDDTATADEMFVSTTSNGEPDLDDKSDSKRGLEYVLWRILRVGYINWAQDASTPDGGGNSTTLPDVRVKPKNGGKKAYICNAHTKNAGTIGDHNCDVPTFFTGFLQKLVGGVVNQGVTNSATESAFMGEFEGPEGSDRPWGLSYYTPSNIRPNNSSPKYTALELFGYNLRLTTYNGEWDDIEVYTSARALSNFGTFDKLGVFLSAAFDGLEAVAGHIMDTSQAWGAKVPVLGHFVGGLWGAISCWWKCPKLVIEAVVRRLMDTSDYNVIRSGGWYRPDFGNTLYGARELTDIEIQNIIISNLLIWLTENNQGKGVSKNWDAIGPGMAPPELPVCKTKDGSWNALEGLSWPDLVSSQPLRSATECLTIANTNGGDASGNPYTLDDIIYESPQTLSSWKNSSWGPAQTEFTGTNYAFCEGAAYSVNTESLEWEQYVKRVNTIYDCLVNEGVAAKNAYFGELQREKDKASEAKLGILVNLGFEDFEETLESQTQKIVGNFIAPSSRYVCVDKNGKDIPNQENSPNLEKRYTFLFEKDVNAGAEGTFYKYNQACLGENKAYRAPIQDGLFGNGYGNGQPDWTKDHIHDPRRAVYSQKLSTIWMDIFFGAGGLAGKMTGVPLMITSFTTKMSNTVLNLALSPLLENLGVNQIVIDGMGGLRDSVFYPLIVILMAFAGITIFISAVKSREYITQLKNVLLVIASFMMSVMILERPETVMTVVDKAPAKVEAVIVGSIFQVDDEEANLCSASSTQTNDIEGWEPGDALPFSPQASSRTLLCENWRAFYFNNYVHAQWGTTYENLDVSQMENQNGELVGDAPVPMGNGTVENNWALYQVASMSTGTTSTYDPGNPSGGINRDIYRLVDLQFHPDFASWSADGPSSTGYSPTLTHMGAPDTRYAENWAGVHPQPRMLVTFLGLILALLGITTVTIYSFFKILVTLQLSLLLLILPIMLLIGVHPTFGRTKLKSYLGDLLSLAIQRVMLVVLLAMMMRIISSIASSAENYLIYFIMVAATCIAFIMYRKEIIDLFANAPTDALGSVRDNFKVDKQQFNKSVPLSIRNYGEQRVKMAGATLTGAAGGLLAGDLKRGITENQKRVGARTERKQRSMGTGLLQAFGESSRAGTKSALDDAAKVLTQRGDEIQGTLGNKRLSDTLSKDGNKARIKKNDEHDGLNKMLSRGEGGEAAELKRSDIRDAMRLNRAIEKREKQEAKFAEHKGFRKRYTSIGEAEDIRQTIATDKTVSAKEVFDQADRLSNMKQQYISSEQEKVDKVANKINKKRTRQTNRKVMVRKGATYAADKTKEFALGLGEEPAKDRLNRYKDGAKDAQETLIDVYSKLAYGAPSSSYLADKQKRFSSKFTGDENN